jgi:hypothetical protein
MKLNELSSWFCPSILSTPTGKLPPLAVRLAEALPFRRAEEWSREPPFNEPSRSLGRRFPGKTGKANLHVRWYCKYHIVFVPKDRRRSLYGPLRRSIGRIIRESCSQRGGELVEGQAMPDPVPLCLRIPPRTVWPTP